MRLIRWNPMIPSVPRDMVSIQDEVNRLFDSFFAGVSPRGNGLPFRPAADVEETAEDFVVRLDLPGVSSKDVKVNLMADTLTIRGERKHESEHQDQSYQRTERCYGSFERSFTFGAPVKNDGVKAKFRDGVLEIRVPKAEEAKVREIEVQVAS